MPFTCSPPAGVYPGRPSYSKQELQAAYVGRELADLRTPALIVDKQKTERNCHELLEAAKQAGVAVRVHVKTHKTIEGALLQLGETTNSICVSTLAEARYFAQSGLFQDILYAVPLSPDKIQEVYQLSQAVEQLHVFVDNETIIDALERFAVAMGSGSTGVGHSPLGSACFRAFLKIDTGYHRAGVPSTTSLAIRLAKRLHQSPYISFSGIYSHSGHAYSAAGLNEGLEIAREEVRLTLMLAQELRNNGVTAPIASVGATPSIKALLEVAGAGREALMEARLDATESNEVFLDETKELATDIAESALPAEEQSGVLSDQTEIEQSSSLAPDVFDDFKLEVHLGNYIFLDVQQISGMPWDISRCAATVLTRVLSHYPHRGEALVDAGALALSKDGPGERGQKQHPGFGVVVAEGLPSSTINRLSQEHGLISNLTPEEIETYLPIGSCIQIVPNHACLAAANFDWYYVVEEGKVVDIWVPCRGW
ncbi:hypothetical protein DFS34DRAFT_653445 [Phlyctochytrium arcticum]|nr:hypothetical protein DFS34DRAFT_653445 [Phlyctochytrium arcticum]